MLDFINWGVFFHSTVLMALMLYKALMGSIGVLFHSRKFRLKDFTVFRHSLEHPLEQFIVALLAYTYTIGVFLISTERLFYS